MYGNLFRIQKKHGTSLYMTFSETGNQHRIFIIQLHLKVVTIKALHKKRRMGQKTGSVIKSWNFDMRENGCSQDVWSVEQTSHVAWKYNPTFMQFWLFFVNRNSRNEVQSAKSGTYRKSRRKQKSSFVILHGCVHFASTRQWLDFHLLSMSWLRQVLLVVWSPHNILARISINENIAIVRCGSALHWQKFAVFHACNLSSFSSTCASKLLHLCRTHTTKQAVCRFSLQQQQAALQTCVDWGRADSLRFFSLSRQLSLVVHGSRYFSPVSPCPYILHPCGVLVCGTFINCNASCMC